MLKASHKMPKIDNTIDHMQLQRCGKFNYFLVTFTQFVTHTSLTQVKAYKTHLNFTTFTHTTTHTLTHTH